MQKRSSLYCNERYSASCGYILTSFSIKGSAKPYYSELSFQPRKKFPLFRILRRNVPSRCSKYTRSIMAVGNITAVTSVTA